MRMYKAMEIEMRHLSWLLYGKSRSGKTTLVGTYPEPILVTNFANENGAVTLRGHPAAEIVQIEKSTDVEEMVEWFLRNQSERKYGTIAIDSVTSWIEMMRAEHTAAGRPTTMPAVLPYYAEWAQRVLAVIDRLRSFPVERVYVTTASLNKDDVDGLIHGGPDMFRSLENRVPAKMDAVMYAESGSDKDGPYYAVNLSPKGGIIAGVRGYKGPGEIRNPSFASIRERLQGSLFGNEGVN